MKYEEYRRRVEAKEITVTAACRELGISRQTWYNLVNPKPKKPRKPREKSGHNKARATAEDAMQDLSELREMLDAAWAAYMSVRVVYEDKLQMLRTYRHRGIISQEEYDQYRINGGTLNRPDLQSELSRYRANK